MLKLKTQLDIVKYSLWAQKFYARGRPGGVGPPSINLGPPNISESTRAGKLKLKSQLDMVKYSRYVHMYFFPLGPSRGTKPSIGTLGPPAVICVLSEVGS